MVIYCEKAIHHSKMAFDLKPTDDDYRKTHGRMIAKVNMIEVRVCELIWSFESSSAIFYGDWEGNWPKRLEDLLPNKVYRGTGYLDSIPPDPIKHSNKTVAKFDGSGGWYYNPRTGKTQLNVSGEDRSGKKYRDYCKGVKWGDL